ncbi:hypothetical protein PspLS_03623 [Pyricularia sp. CBS 133598]|nr:hypothetical protein PspLS_03623 [Pyricularia sp. CBS 133598]
MTSASASPTAPPATTKLAIPLPIASPPITPLLSTPIAVFVIIVSTSPRGETHRILLTSRLLDLDRRRVELWIPAGMSTLLTQPPVGTEAAQIVGTQVPPDVLLAAPGAERAKALVVVRTRRQLALRVDVQVQTLLAVLAVAVADVKVALGHAAQVVLVQELAPVALLAQAAQPMLAHQAVEGRAVALAAPVPGLAARGLRRVRDVPLQTPRAVGAVAARRVDFAYRPVRREAVLRKDALEKGTGRKID